jgi:hypothetical protein
MDRIYLLFDARACGGVGTDRAVCVYIAESEQEARSRQDDFGAVACYSYAQMKGDEKTHLKDEQWEWDYIPLDKVKRNRK